MSRHKQFIFTSQESFICLHCGRTVMPADSATRNRNHCPHCLHSRHVDIRPGDRRCACKAKMEAISVYVQKNGEWSIIHRCIDCGVIKLNRIAPDDNETALLALAAKPLTQLPFPIEVLQHV